MGKVISFNNSINETNDKIKSIFNSVINEINKVINEFTDLDEDTINELKYLENYIRELSLKIENKNWKSKTVEERFIDTYDYFKEIKDDELWKVFCISELIYFTDINSSILDENKDYTNLILVALDTNMEEIGIKSKEVINKVISDVQKPIIKNVFNNYDEDQSYKMIDIVDGISSGIDLITVSNWYKDEKELENDSYSLKNGILTIDRIYNYYIEQEYYNYLFKKLALEQHNEDTKKIEQEHNYNVSILNKILLLNSYSESDKLKYIDTIRKINSNYALEEQIDKVINLTDGYLIHLEETSEDNLKIRY